MSTHRATVRMRCAVGAQQRLAHLQRAERTATWRRFSGAGPAAYLASQAQQDAVAARIWNNGAGPSDWVCACLVGVR